MRTIYRRSMLAGAACLLASAALRLRANEAAAFTTIDMDWVDNARQRPVPVRLLPAASAAAPPGVPLVVFSHGVGGSRRG